MNLQAFGISALECLQSQNLSHPENRLSLKALAMVHGRLARATGLSQWKSGLMSAPRLPQAEQVNFGSRSDSRTSSGHRSPTGVGMDGPPVTSRRRTSARSASPYNTTCCRRRLACRDRRRRADSTNALAEALFRWLRLLQRSWQQPPRSSRA